MNLTTDYNEVTDPSSKKHGTDIMTIFYFTILSVIILGGSIGNITSFCLFSFRPRLRSQPVSVYICGLAVVDTGFLWAANNTEEWAFHLFKHYLPVVGTMCNVQWFLMPTFSAASAWINVVMTFDRILAVFLPLHYKVNIYYQAHFKFKFRIEVHVFIKLFQNMYSRKRSMLAVLFVLSCIAAAFFPTLFAFQPHSTCYVNNNRFSFIYAHYVWPTLLTILVTAVPDIIFFVGNIAILIRVRRHRSEVTSGGSQTSDATSQGRVTRTAVTLSLTHLILNLPAIIYSNVSQHQLENQLRNPVDMWLLCLGTSNFAINILICLVTSQVFRQELFAVFCSLVPRKCTDGD